MSGLPKGWLEVSCGSTFVQISTSNLKVKSKDTLLVGKFPVVDQGASFIAGYVNDEDKVIEVNSPICVFGDHTRIIKWIDFNFVPGADGTKILVPCEYLYPRYFYYQIKSLDVIDRGYSRHFQYLKESIFRIAPLSEQVHIANKLDSILANVDKAQVRLEKIPVILKRFRQSVLAAAASGELTREWREEKKCCEWTNFELKEICESISDGDHQAPPKVDSGIPFLVISNVKKGNVDFENVSRWVPKEYFYNLKDIRKPKRKDVLYTVTGSLGIPVIVDTDMEFCFQRHIAIIKPNHDLVDYRYLSFYLASPSVLSHAESVATGTAQKTVSLTHLRKFDISLPSIDEQKEIVRRIEVLFSMEAAIEKQYHESKYRIDRLTQSILVKAFKGELVPQNSSDEPAFELLKRIQAEREQEKANPKKTREVTKKKKKIMTLSQAPETYLFDLLTKLGGEAQAEYLWKQSELSIDDFYTKLKQEMAKQRIIDDNKSPDPSLRKLKVA